ncbi:MAG: TerB N-terminal domain-containing protein [Methylicorpusculum sp.]|uniref:tellurite resistance TerB family protein n=1 Tax=Methylicorpusculum sp. TaxID=2713644 RepID=UPI00272F8EF0|nr:TerB N-terminal domain-containing protein [Methylicorpusculum sp.]MDP2200821.1 TerB N-terminal domain-containing protein [Methylicorpusculum sp.]
MGRRRKKSGSGNAFFVLLLVIIAIVSEVPKIIWISMGCLIIILFPFYLYGKYKTSKSDQTLKDKKNTNKPPSKKVAKVIQSSRSAEVDDAPVSVPSTSFYPSSEPNFSIPSAPKGYGAATWIPRGQSINVSGVTIPDGMVYVGTSLKTPYSGNDPCLLDPSKTVSSRGDYTQSDMGYWPSYSEISASSRRSYLDWLANGKRDPNADIGYVFLFFYGLERRAIVDVANNAEAKNDWPIIADEIRRLLEIYGDQSNSFRNYANDLLNWISLADAPERLYEKPVPVFPKTYELPGYLRLALGQAAVDAIPVPQHLALAWAKLEPNISLRTPAKRCSEQFDKLFLLKYSDTFGDGILLPRNRTKLKLVYRPASSGFHGYGDIKLTFGEIPDVTALTAPLKKLQQIVEVITKELEPYSRFIGKNPDAEIALEGLIQLPTALWPEEAQKNFHVLKTRIGSGMVAMPFHELLTALGANSTLNRDKTLMLGRALAAINIGIEPNILNGVKLPKSTDNVVLFNIPSEDMESVATPSYQAALLTLQLASAVAAADGQFSATEIIHLSQEVKSWSHLTPNDRCRLLAHLRLLVVTPVSMASMKKKLEPLDASTRESIAVFMATVAQSDGTVSPDEVKILEKVYKALGVDANKVFSDIHAVATGIKSTAATTANIEDTGFKLDLSRVAALQQDTEKVSLLLANIFKEEDTVAAQLTELGVEPENELVPDGIFGLDSAHTAFARMLLSRPEWSREELIDLAADLELMLDGALEHINEAAFDTHDIPFTEGDDPIEVNAEILEKIEA